jgi:CHASE domain/Adenylate and Guanylate cyclase catalytic domain
LESSVYESSSVEDGNDDNVSISSITPMMKRSKIMIFIVLLLGLGGGTAFIYFGIQGEMAASDESFQVRATQLTKDIGATVQEYETAARSVQDVCRRRETTRHQFRQFYEYLISGGLQVQAAQCLPNVTHDERATFEQDALAYYSEFYPDIVNYTGFKGWEYDNETDKYVLTPGRSEAPFYFPVDKCEPVLTNSAALGLDTYSHTFQKQEIDQAIATNQPILGGRLKLVQETEENAYTVIMRHPGVRVADIDKDNADGSNSNNNDSPINLDDEQVSRDIGNILIRIPSLLKRRGQEQKESIACYLYDITPEHASDGMTHVYLGAAEFDAQLANGTVVTEVRIPPNDTEYEDVLSSQQGTRLLRRPRIFQSNVTFASNAIWTLVITPIPGDDSFQPKVAEIVFGGAMILVSTIGLALFLWHNMKQVEKIHKAKSQAEAERNIIASLYPENVVERLLDDERAKQEASRETARNKGKIFDGAATSTVDSSRPGDNSHIHDAMHPIESVGGDGGVLSIFGSDPIAHHYEETTVVFMDMVGFTSWSKSREPARVFALLENVYNAFDLVAKRRRVFKGTLPARCTMPLLSSHPQQSYANINNFCWIPSVAVETVGDCYVAVTGVPDARRNHAAAMVLFANACLQKMTSLMNQLAPVLGEDTTALSLRVGMSR